MFVAHNSGVLLNLLAGKNIDYFFFNFPASANDTPADAGYALWIVYASWIAGLLLLYPICRRYDKIKQSRRGFPFNYL